MSVRPATSRLRDLLLATPVLVVALWLLWGSVFLFIKTGVEHAPVSVFVLLRVVAAVLGVGVLMALAPDRGEVTYDRRVLHRYAALLGLISVTLYLGLLAAGIAHSHVGFSSVVIYTQPLLVALLARSWLGERLSARQGTGLLLGWVGVAFATTSGLQIGASDRVGVALLLVGAGTWAIGSVLFKRVPADLPPWRMVLWQNIYGIPGLVLLTLVWRDGPVDWGVPLVASALAAGIGAGAGGWGIQYLLLRRGKAGVVSSWIFPVPIVSTVLGVVVRDEPLTAGFIGGAVAVAGGIWLVTAPARRAGGGVPPP